MREMEAHLDHGEKNTDRTKHRFGWRDARRLFHDTQDVNGNIQRGGNGLPMLWWPSIGVHARIQGDFDKCYV